MFEYFCWDIGMFLFEQYMREYSGIGAKYATIDFLYRLG